MKNLKLNLKVIISIAIIGLTACSKEKIEPISVEFGTFTDTRDGNTYETVKLGQQTWLAENFKYLPEVSGCYEGSEDEEYENEPFYYVYQNSSTDIEVAKKHSNYEKLGVYYNWHAALEACPEGWHLPSVEEWNQLIDYLGGANVAGGKLKATGTAIWKAPNEGATNESGFSAIPIHYRFPTPYSCFNNVIVSSAFLWSSSEREDNRKFAYKFQMTYLTTEIKKNDDFKFSGLSVRYIKD